MAGQETEGTGEKHVDPGLVWEGDLWKYWCSRGKIRRNTWPCYDPEEICQLRQELGEHYLRYADSDDPGLAHHEQKITDGSSLISQGDRRTEDSKDNIDSEDEAHNTGAGTSQGKPKTLPNRDTDTDANAD